MRACVRPHTRVGTCLQIVCVAANSAGPEHSVPETSYTWPVRGLPPLEERAGDSGGSRTVCGGSAGCWERSGEEGRRGSKSGMTMAMGRHWDNRTMGRRLQERAAGTEDGTMGRQELVFL
jgi:hypothetical protein